MTPHDILHIPHSMERSSVLLQQSRLKGLFLKAGGNKMQVGLHDCKFQSWLERMSQQFLVFDFASLNNHQEVQVCKRYLVILKKLNLQTAQLYLLNKSA